MKKTKVSTAANSFSRLITEIKTEYNWVKDIYYSKRAEVWVLEDIYGNSVEIGSFSKVYHHCLITDLPF